ncbi:hypothetical protein SLE2022_367480 [Rubroshorea leprosula]
MAQLLNLNPLGSRSSTRPESSHLQPLSAAHYYYGNGSFTILLQNLKCNSKFTCLFSDNRSRREEQARKALESALGGKKNEFEKWNKEIKRREEAGGGGGAGGRGWFGWGGRFGWSNDDHFWQETKQTSLTVLGIILMYLIVAKGELLLAVIVNPLLYALRGTRDGLTSLTSRILGKTYVGGLAKSDNISMKGVYGQVSAKDRVLRKWGSD